MRVFITGATGFVGSAVTRNLIAAGHEVVGLVRSDASAARLEAMGGKPLRGDLTTLDVLAEGARDADGVIHCGFIHDFTNYAAAAQTDRVAIETIGTALAGSNRPFLVTSGLAGLPGDRVCTELDDIDPGLERRLPRVSEKTGLGLVEKGVRASIIRLPASTHGDGDHGFVPTLIGIARDKGVAAYIGEGSNCWPAGHVDDAAEVYRLALEKGRAGARYHAVGDAGITLREIAEVIGRKLGVPVRSVSPEEAPAHFGWIAPFTLINARASSRITEEELGWRPTRPGLIADLETGTYFAA